MTEVNRQEGNRKAEVSRTEQLVMVLDRECRIASFNSACERLSGYSLAEVKGRFVWDILLPPDEVDQVRKHLSDAVNSDPEKLAGEYSNHWIAKNLRRYHLEWTNTILTDPEGMLEYIVCTGLDVGGFEQVESSLRLHSQMVDQIQDSVVATDLEGKVTSWNKGAERIFGYRAEEVKGRYIGFMYPEDQQSVLIRDVIEPLKEQGVHDLEVVMQRRNGKRFWAHLSLSLLYDRDGNIDGMVGYTKDISRRKVAENELRVNEMRMRMLLSSNPVVIYTGRADGDYGATYVSPNIKDLFGYSPEQFTSNSGFWMDHIHPDDVEQVMAELPALFEHDRHVHEYRFRLYDGSYRWIYDALRLIRDDVGQPIEIVGSWKDITERKLAEQQERLSNQILTAVLDTAPVLIAHLDPDFNFVRVNRAYADADGKKVSFFPGKNHFNLYPNEENETIFKRVVKTGEPYNAQARPFEYEHDPDRGVTHWDWTLAPIREGGEVTGLVLSLQNVTDRIKTMESLQRNEQELIELNELLEEKVRARTQDMREAQRIGGIGTWFWNIKTSELTWSDETYRIMGLDPETFDAVFEAYMERVHPDDVEGVRKDLQNAMRGIPYESDHRVVHANGEMLWVQAHGQVVYDENRQPVMMRGTFQDITERKLAEAILKASLEEKEVLLKEVHHRVKNNMAMVSAFMQLQTRQTNSQSAIDALTECDNRIRAMALVHKKLYQSSNLTSISMAGLFQELSNALQSQTQQQFINVRIDTHGIALVMDVAIPCAMIINELISNSLKHAFPDNQQGRINIEMQKKENGYILDYRDSGPGLPPDTGIENSSSLGLQLIAVFVQQLSGSLELNECNRSHFYINFPFGDSELNTFHE